MRLVVSFPSNAHMWGPDALMQLARSAEAVGYDEIDTYDHVALGHPIEGRSGRLPPDWPCLEPLVMLGMLAAATSRIRLGTGIVSLPQRQPALVAKQVSTLDVLSGGRIRLGVGLGSLPEEFEAMGVPFTDRGERMEEAITLMRLYWTEEIVNHRGRHYQANAVHMEPRPIQRGGPPIWIGGGGSDVALRRIGRLADGWLAGRWQPAEYAIRAVRVIREEATRCGRDASSVGMQVQLGHGTPGEIAATARGRREQGFEGGEIDLTTAFDAGVDTPEHATDFLGKVREAVLKEVA